MNTLQVERTLLKGITFQALTAKQWQTVDAYVTSVLCGLSTISRARAALVVDLKGGFDSLDHVPTLNRLA